MFANYVAIYTDDFRFISFVGDLDSDGASLIEAAHGIQAAFEKLTEKQMSLLTAARTAIKVNENGSIVFVEA